MHVGCNAAEDCANVACREVRGMQESIAKGSFVPESQLYQQAQREIHAAREDAERQRLLISTLQQERAVLQSRQQSQELQVYSTIPK